MMDFCTVHSQAIPACITCSPNEKGFCTEKNLYSITAHGRLIASYWVYFMLFIYDYFTFGRTVQYVLWFSPPCLCPSSSTFPPLLSHLSFCFLWQSWTMLSWTAVLWSPGLPVSSRCLFVHWNEFGIGSIGRVVLRFIGGLCTLSSV